MAGELRCQYIQSGLDIWALIRNRNSLLLVDGTFEVYDDNLVDDAKIPTAEQGTSKYYVGNMPAGLPADVYYIVFQYQDGADIIEANSQAIQWDGTKEIPLSEALEGIAGIYELVEDLSIGNIATGGGILHARIADASLFEHEYLEIIQGEEKVVTFIVEAIGRFDIASADTIRAKFLDPFGNLVSKNGSSIERVCEELDVQVIRVTLDPADTEQLEQGLLKIELSFDTQKAQLTHSMKVAEKL